MDKKTFFGEIHTKLGLKHNLNKYQVGTIRAFVGAKKTRKEIGEWCAVKLTLPKLPKQRTIEHYQQILNFTASCKEEQWTDINQYANWANEAGTEPQPSKSD